MSAQLTLAPRHTQLAKDTPASLDLLVRLQAPAQAPSPDRAPLNLCLCIDRSGSMAGDPIEQAKLAAIHLVSQLQKGDLISVVAYSSRADLLVEPMDAAAGKYAVIQKIQSIYADGGTGLRAGWLEAAKAIAPYQSKYGISRVLLLSDGQATDGSTPEALGAEAAELCAAGLTTSTYGLGYNFNEALMTQLGQQGGGLAFYAATADELVPYFESEFAMLSSAVGRAVSVQVTAEVVLPGGKPTKGKALVVERLDTLAAVTNQRVGMPALIAGAESWVALRVQVPKLAAKHGVALSVDVQWQSMDGTTHHQTVDQVVLAGAKAVETLDESALERLKEVEAARLQREAVAEARRGNWEGARSMIRGMSASAGNNAYIANVAASLEGLAMSGDLNAFSKEVAYSSHAMTSRIADVNEDATVLSADRFNLRKAAQSRSSR